MSRLDLCISHFEYNPLAGMLRVDDRYPGLSELGMWRTSTMADVRKDYQILAPYAACYAPGTLRLPSRLPFNTFPASLRFLTINHFRLEASAVASIVRLPDLDMLLLTGLAVSQEHFEPISASRLRVVGFKGVGPHAVTALLAPLSPSIQHLALIGIDSASYESIDGSRIGLAPTLYSLVVLVLPLPSGALDIGRPHTSVNPDDALRGCARVAGTDLRLEHCQAEDEVDSHDLEQWARERGALCD
ncbi:hypothetical protein BJY59DRAFT_716972 [Rhodotorula toruloides]